MNAPRSNPQPAAGAGISALVGDAQDPAGAAALAQIRKDDPRTALEMWQRRVGKTPQAIAFRFHEGGQWRTMTYGAADEAAHEIAAGLVARGVLPGDRVALLSQTRLEWVLFDVATLLAGAVTVPIYASNTAEQCEFIVRDAGAKLVVVEDEAQREKLMSVRERLFTVSAVVQVAGEPPGAATPADLVEMLEALRAAGRTWSAAHPGELELRSRTLEPDSTFTIIYTSGTTGVPKGVVLTHDNLVAGICSAIRAMKILGDDVQYLFLPLAHVLGRELEWAAIEIGCETAMSRGTAYVKDDLVVIRPTFMAGVPRIFEKFYAGVKGAIDKSSGLRRRLAEWALRVGKQRGGLQPALADKLVLSKLRERLGLDRCRFLISGGAPLAAEIAQFFEGARLIILEGYGLTETVAAAFLNRQDNYRFGTVGLALDVVDTKIADDGEILVRGPSIFRQYYNNPPATAEAIDAEGWFHTGDIGVLEDGFLRITDRKKDLIVTAGGKKVAPQALENALKARSTLFSQVLVYGDKRPYCVAIVTLSDEARKRYAGAGGDEASLPESAEARAAVQKEIDGLNATLASFESIKRFAILPGDLTEASGDLTPKLSVKRKVVIEKYRATLDGLYRGASPSGAGSQAD
jgi:long-chain acyl-CoA synthetase